ncbi:mitochondrial MRF1 N(5)-glutamine methyltransferase Mtq1p [Trichomonascus vanleenenianus]|uniref:S-adenosylmethionine-dependent methyltransferase n=1 Tax=Trichomonascus vanleenenianus TaxID=2268995 RepID=UPI003ECBA5D4
MRLKSQTIRNAARVHPCLPLLLPTCRTLEAATQELRWIRNELKEGVRNACYRRGVLGHPLQYVLGTQPFGPLEIKCGKGVLVPRWETEEWTMRLGGLLKGRQLRILDLCTGTGCIPLLLASSYLSESKIWAVDVSPSAQRLFAANATRYETETDARHNAVRFSLHDIFSPLSASKSLGNIGHIDLVTANPPYISEHDYYAETERSVRLHEPRLALVGGLEYYDAVFNRALEVGASALVCEVGAQAQIDYVQKRVQAAGWLASVPVTDAAGKPRAVAAWKSPNWSFLANMRSPPHT